MNTKLIEMAQKAATQWEGTDAYHQAAQIISMLIDEIKHNDIGCDCCNGDEALFYQDNKNCAFVDSHGEIMVVVKDHTMRFKVDCCPKCGRRFSTISA